MPGATFIDLFCGAGGASCGFQQAGAQPVLGVDEDSAALDAWERNVHGETSCATLTPENAAEALPPAARGMHLHASAPCQLLSRQRLGGTSEELQAGLRLFRLSMELPLLRGDHTWSSEQVSSPPAVKLAAAMTKRFPDRVDFAIVDAADFGAPSTRSRLIVGPPRLIARLRKMGTAPRVSMRDAFRTYGLEVPEGAVAVTMSRGAASPKNKPRRLDGVGFTVLASHPMTWLDSDGKSLGCLTWRHSAALMGFGPEWRFPKTTRAAQRAAGNAVPPPLAKAIMIAAIQVQHGSPDLPPPLEPSELMGVGESAPPAPPRSSPPRPTPTDGTEMLLAIDRIQAELDKLRRMVVP